MPDQDGEAASILPTLGSEGSTSTMIDCEPYVLGGLGYEADLFEDEIEQHQYPSQANGDQETFKRSKANEAISIYKRKIQQDTAAKFPSGV
jgi:hypothetical protein